MGWEDELFTVLDDLEQQADGMFAAERDLEVADRSRAEYHRVTLASRLMASVGDPTALEVRGVGTVSGTLRRTTATWCLVEAGGQDWVVPYASVDAVYGASARSVPELAWSPLHQLGLGSALLRIAEASETCVVHLVDGARHEARLARVGHDFVEVEVGRGRSALFPFAAIGAVSSRRQ